MVLPLFESLYDECKEYEYEIDCMKSKTLANMK